MTLHIMCQHMTQLQVAGGSRGIESLERCADGTKWRSRLDPSPVICSFASSFPLSFSTYNCPLRPPRQISCFHVPCVSMSRIFLDFALGYALRSGDSERPQLPPPTVVRPPPWTE